MAWVRFATLAAGLSLQSIWRAWAATHKPEPVRLEGSAIDAYFRGVT